MSVNEISAEMFCNRVNFVNIGKSILKKKSIIENFAKKEKINLRIACNTDFPELSNALSKKNVDYYTILTGKSNKKGNIGFSSFIIKKEESDEKLVQKIFKEIKKTTEYVKPFNKLKKKFISLFRHKQ